MLQIVWSTTNNSIMSKKWQEEDVSNFRKILSCTIVVFLLSFFLFYFLLFFTNRNWEKECCIVIKWLYTYHYSLTNKKRKQNCCFKRCYKNVVHILLPILLFIARISFPSPESISSPQKIGWINLNFARYKIGLVKN